MQATAAYIGNEQDIDIPAAEKETRELQDAFSRCLPLLHRTAYRYLGNAADAEDAVQDALLSAYKHLDQFRGQAQMSTWLVAIVSNCARMQLRRRPRQIHVSLNDQFGDEEGYTLSERLVHFGPSPEEEYRKAELHERITQFAEELSPPLRRAFQLRDLDGLTTREAAQGSRSSRRNGEGPDRTGPRKAHASCAPGTRRKAASSARPHVLAGCRRQVTTVSEPTELR
jgi:RNA polymerase sigma factor (sigma-70 family)